MSDADVTYVYRRGVGWIPSASLASDYLSKQFGPFTVTVEKRIPTDGEYYWVAHKNETIEHVMELLEGDYINNYLSVEHPPGGQRVGSETSRYWEDYTFWTITVTK